MLSDYSLSSQRREQIIFLTIEQTVTGIPSHQNHYANVDSSLASYSSLKIRHFRLKSKLHSSTTLRPKHRIGRSEYIQRTKNNARSAERKLTIVLKIQFVFQRVFERVFIPRPFCFGGSTPPTLDLCTSAQVLGLTSSITRKVLYSASGQVLALFAPTAHESFSRVPAEL